MCIYSKQTKQATEVETLFKAKIDKFSEFKHSDNINGFSFSKTPIIIDEHPEIITQYNCV